MKKLLIISMLVFAGCGTMRTTGSTVQADAAIAEKLQSRNYTIGFDLMSTQSGRTRTLANLWDIRVEGEHLRSYLPYFGEAYMPTLSTGEGLNFEAEMHDYQQSGGRNGQVRIDFWVRSGEDRYEYSLTVYPGGGATLRVTPDRKSAVTFEGRMKL